MFHCFMFLPSDYQIYRWFTAELRLSDMQCSGDLGDSFYSLTLAEDFD